MTDPISDMLTRIRNAQHALHAEVSLPHSKMKESIAQILKHEGYIADCQSDGKTIKTLRLKLKYNGRKAVISGLKRASSPGLRLFVQAREIPRVLSGMGTTILSTSRGIMTGGNARKQNLGGELLCFVW